MYQWWVFVHLVGVFAFLAAHGVSMSVMFRLRTERDPKRVNDLLQVSASSLRAFYPSLGLLLVGGIVAGFLGHWWSQGWIWAAIVILVLATLAMYALATPYYRRVRLVARAMADGSSAVTPSQFDELLRSPRATSIAVIGVVALGAILYFMLFKPALWSAGATAPPPAASGSVSGPTIQLSAGPLSFSVTSLTVPAATPLRILFANQAPGVAHNVAIYSDSSASKTLFRGAVFTGPKTETYSAPALSAGTYFFRCDVHPAQMTGAIVAK
jgi:plastocyanin